MCDKNNFFMQLNASVHMNISSLREWVSANIDIWTDNSLASQVFSEIIVLSFFSFSYMQALKI